MTNRQLLEAWYRYAAGATGFIGRALRAHNAKKRFSLKSSSAQ